MKKKLSKKVYTCEKCEGIGRIRTKAELLLCEECDGTGLHIVTIENPKK